MRRLYIFIFVLLLSGFLAASAIAALLGIRGSGAPAAAAPPSLYVSPTGSDSASCSQSAPCQSFDRAYTVAQPGQVVEIMAGNYPAQQIKTNTSKSGARVIFKPVAGAQVTVGGLSVQGSHVEFQDIATGSWVAGINNNRISPESQTTDVVFRRVNTQIFSVNGASTLSVLGGSVGPTVNNASQIRNCYLCTYAPQNIVVDGVTFRDYTRTDPKKHMECLHVYPAQRFVLRNSRFRNCAIIDVLLQNYGSGGDLSDITIENNVFDKPGSLAGGLSKGYYPLAFGPVNRSMTNVRVAYNSFVGSISVNPGGTLTNVAFIANVGSMGQYGCVRGVTYAYNVWTAAKCSPTDTVAPSSFRDPKELDLHLLRGAKAIGRGDPSGRPATDIDGDLRPSQWAPDAGADQWETSLMVFGRSIGVARLGETEADVTAFYGAPRRIGTAVFGKQRLRRLTYRLHGGDLWLFENDARVVVGIGTSSQYYGTFKGIGVGTEVAGMSGGSRFVWLDCRRSYRRRLGGSSVYFAPRGGKDGKTIAQIVMVKNGYGYESCSR